MCPMGMQVLHEVPRVNLMGTGEQQASAAGNVGVLHSLGPSRIGRRYVIDRWQPVLVRTGNVDERKVPGLVRRRLANFGFFRAGDSNDVPLHQKSAKLRKLLTRGGDRV